MDNYRQYLIGQIKICPQINNSLLLKRLKPTTYAMKVTIITNSLIIGELVIIFNTFLRGRGAPNLYKSEIFGLKIPKWVKGGLDKNKTFNFDPPGVKINLYREKGGFK